MSSDAEGVSLTLLFVDDDAGVLKALGRLFRPLGHKLLFAENAEQALQTLREEPIDLLVADMRMPGLSGAQLLAEVATEYPKTYRMLMTGHADINAAIGGLNSGKICRFITKPWVDDELMNAVRGILEIRSLEKEKEALEAEALQQNEALRDLNVNLDQKAQERTAEYQKLSDELRDKFIRAVRVFANMVELRGGILSGHSARVARMAVEIAKAMELPPVEVEEIELGSLLHDLGKLGFSDDLLAKPVAKLNYQEVRVHRTHPEMGYQAILAMLDVASVSKVIRHHHEMWNGTGYPDQLKGEDIPLNARIVAVANDYDSMISGTMGAIKYKPDQALKAIIKEKGKRYDPVVVEAFTAVINGGVAREFEKLIKQTDARVGMKLTRDVVNTEGVVLVGEGQVLTERFVEKILDYQNPDQSPLKVWVYVEPKEHTAPVAPTMQLTTDLVMNPAQGVKPDPVANKAFLT